MNTPTDPVAQYNAARWATLVRAKAVFTQPYLDLDEAAARDLVDPDGRFGDLRGQRVLCLAGGGGQQSAAFALLGAQVTVVDLAAEQLAQDQAAAAHYGFSVTTLQGDMRDLSPLHGAGFDLVYHPYSINFVPDARAVFRQVAQVLRPGGHYYFNCANPCFAGLMISEWDGHGYPLRRPYVDGAEIRYADESWIFRGEQPAEAIGGPVEYRHTLSTLVNGLIEAGFTLTRLQEEFLGTPDFNAEPGTSEHFTSIAPPWLRFWATLQG
jgi:SAM-dependent methyltransferase